MKLILKFLLKPFLGKRYLQKFFGGMFLLSLKGMNIGGGSTYSQSGEEWVFKFVSSKFKSTGKLLAFDVGANIGGYAKIAAQIFTRAKLEYQIYCFEPSHTTFERLKENTKDLAAIKNFQIALGKQAGVSELFSNEAGSGLASLYQRDLKHAGVAMKAQERINVKTIDEFCNENKISRINFLKLDVEGYELNALQGAGKMLAGGAIDIIQFEFGGTDIDARIYFKDFFGLLSPGYRLYRVLQNGLFELSHYTETQEIFMTTNFLAVRKGL